MRRDARGVTLVEPVVTLGGLAAPNERACPIVGTALDGLRAQATTDGVYGAVPPTRARACATGLMPALVVEPDTVGIVEDHAGAARIVSGPHRLMEGVVASEKYDVPLHTQGGSPSRRGPSPSRAAPRSVG